MFSFSSRSFFRPDKESAFAEFFGGSTFGSSVFSDNFCVDCSSETPCCSCFSG